VIGLHAAPGMVCSAFEGASALAHRCRRLAGFDASTRPSGIAEKMVACCHFQLRAGKKLISEIKVRERAVSLAGRGFEQLPEKVI